MESCKRVSIVIASCFVVLFIKPIGGAAFSIPLFLAGNVTMPCDFSTGQPRRVGQGARVADQPCREREGTRYRAPTAMAEIGGGRAQVVGGRPAGYPSSFCGGGASLRVFGRILPGLNLASNWLRFPRTELLPV